jgi:hypothetical protein
MERSGEARARTEVVRLVGGSSVWLVRAQGAALTAGHPALRTAAAAPPECRAVVLDLGAMNTATADGIRELADCARQLAGSGRRLTATGVLAVSGQSRETETGLRIAPSVAAAIAEAAQDAGTPGAGSDGPTVPAARGGDGPVGDASLSTPEPLPPPVQVRIDELLAQVRDVRARAESHPLIAQAQGIIQERYRLRDGQAAFALMRASSQRYNVRLRVLASAVITAGRPSAMDKPWFPGRARLPAPSLAFAGRLDPRHANTAEVLAAALDRALDIAGTDMGNLQLLDPTTGDLRIEKHRGLNDEFVTFFDRVGKGGTSCSLAAEKNQRVSVTDVATDPVFTPEARHAILQAGSRGCHSTPLLNERGALLGMVSSHHQRTVTPLGTAQSAALDAMADQTARWLDWYRRTVVLDTLEDLHTRAVHLS